MAHATCDIEACDQPVKARGWCWKHYQRWRRHGDPEGESYSGPRGDSRDGLCGVADCPRVAAKAGWCSMHYFRLWRLGDLGPVEAFAPTYRKVNEHGYVTLYEPDHPLAQRSKGRVLEHRKILYEHLGSGPQPCHHCGTILEWGDGLVTDHLDFDRANNELPNIVPSCLACNTRRQERWLT